jgi:hypothetical protein
LLLRSAAKSFATQSAPKQTLIRPLVHAALEDSGVAGSIKEPRRDTQRANPIRLLHGTTH